MALHSTFFVCFRYRPVRLDLQRSGIIGKPFKRTSTAVSPTAILHWPLSSAATKEVQGPDTTGRRIQGLLFLTCWWYMGAICTFCPSSQNQLTGKTSVDPFPPPSNQPGLSTPPPLPLGVPTPTPCIMKERPASVKTIFRPLIRGRRPQIGLEEDVETILGFSPRLYEVIELSWRPAQVDQRASS